MNTVCNHGYWLHDCSLCHKHTGECDWGSCTEPADVMVEYVHDGRVVERRPMCQRHVPPSLRVHGARLSQRARDLFTSTVDGAAAYERLHGGL